MCECTPVLETTFWSDGGQTPAEVTIEALEEVSEAGDESLPPLYETIDPDTIDELFDRKGRFAAPTDAVLQFSVEDWTVFIRGDGRIRVCDTTRSTDVMPTFEKEVSPRKRCQCGGSD